MRAETHPQQEARLSALRELSVLDSPREQVFDEIVELASRICGAPISVINLIDESRQWFKAEVGLGVRETPLDTSLCSHAILQPGLTEIPDTLLDQRFRDNPLCAGDPHLRFYAGALLETEEGLPIGTLCVLDHEPRALDDLQRFTLSVLAKQVMAQLQLRREIRRASLLLQEVDHRVKNSLSIIGSILMLQANSAPSAEVGEALALARNRVMAVSRLHDQLHATSSVSNVDLKEFLERLAEDLRSQAHAGVQIHADCLGVRVPAPIAVSVGIITNELVTNALRHGFEPGRSGRIDIGCLRDADKIRISVRNDGAPLPDGFNPRGSRGLGMRVALSTATQLGGELAWESREGVCFSFDIAC